MGNMSTDHLARLIVFVAICTGTIISCLIAKNKKKKAVSKDDHIQQIENPEPTQAEPIESESNEKSPEGKSKNTLSHTLNPEKKSKRRKLTELEQALIIIVVILCASTLMAVRYNIDQAHTINGQLDSIQRLQDRITYLQDRIKDLQH